MGATLALLDRTDLIDAEALCRFVLALQRPQGGLGAHPDSSPVSGGRWAAAACAAAAASLHGAPCPLQDLFHTHFGLAALGVLGSDVVAPVDARFCLPTATVAALPAARA